MEAPPVRNILLVIIILAVFTLMISLAPSELITDPDTRKSYEGYVPEGTFEGLYVSAFNTTHLIEPETPIVGYNEDWGADEGFGHDMWFYCANYGDNDTDYIRNSHVFPFLFYYRWNTQHMEWFNNTGYSRGKYLYMDELNIDAQVVENETIASYIVLSAGQFEMKAYVGYNNTLYDHMLDALNNDELRIQFFIDMDEIGRSHGMSAWNIVTQLLFFQLPETTPIINAIIGIILWTLIAVLIFQLVLAVIKALPLT